MKNEVKISFNKKELPLLGYKDHQSFYSGKKWRSLREYKLTMNPFCEHCLEEGYLMLAEEVDHIVPIVDNELLALELSNLQSLCKSHHSKKTAKDRIKKGIGTILNKRYDL